MKATPDKLRIGMLAPVSWPTPPEGYGPWEQVVSNLTEELVKLGHEVTLFAAGGSRTSAKLVETVPHPLEMWPPEERSQPERMDEVSGLLLGPPDFRVLEQLHIGTCLDMAGTGVFDVVHSHLHVHSLPFSRLIPCPMVHTLHGAAWVKATHPVYDRYKNQPFVSLSNAERAFKPDLNYVATVHNGIRLENFPLEEQKEDFLLFAGRISPEKGTAEAVQIARLAGMPLRIAGPVEPKYRDYFDARVKPYIDGRNVIYLGPLTQKVLAKEYRKAKALLFPISWAEPCSLVGIEAQASGTPIIGTKFGYLPELVIGGETGFLVDTVEEAAGKVKQAGTIRPKACRENVRKRFSIRAMAEGYVNAYHKVIRKS